MNSEASCVVYVQLPGSLQVRTCGRYTLEQRPEGTFLGRFFYERSYRDSADSVELDPIQLPLQAGIFETLQLQGVFGALRDGSSCKVCERGIDGPQLPGAKAREWTFSCLPQRESRRVLVEVGHGSTNESVSSLIRSRDALRASCDVFILVTVAA